MNQSYSNPSSFFNFTLKVKGAQSYPTLCNPVDSPWASPGQNIGVGNLFLLQGIFPTQGSNPGLPHCRRILHQLGYQGSPFLCAHSRRAHYPSFHFLKPLIKDHLLQAANPERVWGKQRPSLGSGKAKILSSDLSDTKALLSFFIAHRLSELELLG